MALSKKLRFEVFKRDGFQCAYCGQTPPSVILEIDHIQPKSKNGRDDINNLITACFDCNRGKKDITLDKVPNKIIDNIEILKQKEEQLKEYRKFINTIRKRIENDIDKIQSTFQLYYPHRMFTDSFRKSLRQFIDMLPLDVIIDAMDLSCLRIDDPSRVTQYFCGICWNKIKGRNSNGKKTNGQY